MDFLKTVHGNYLFLSLACCTARSKLVSESTRVQSKCSSTKRKKIKCIDVYKENTRVPFSFPHSQLHNPTLNVAIIKSNVKSLVNILTRFFLGI